MLSCSWASTGFHSQGFQSLSHQYHYGTGGGGGGGGGGGERGEEEGGGGGGGGEEGGVEGRRGRHS